MSDPFQPLEKQVQVTKKCLEIFAETKYPVIISTKGALCIEEPYISLLRNCNVVMQISAVCSSYDRIEQGAPTFEHRLKIIEELSKNVQRVIVRVQPYMIEVYDELCKNITKFKQAGAYGITIEGMKFMKKKEGLIRVGSDYCYPEEILKSHYLRIKELCKKNGLSFFCAENRLRTIGDSMACCGCGDIEGFNGNHFNCVTLINGEKVHATETMKKTGTGKVFNALYQSTFKKKYGDDHSFEQCMLDQAKRMKTKK